LKNLVFSIVVFWGFVASSQNLITNPSFEEIDSCYGAPAGIGFDVFEWSGCKGWSNPIAASSDLYCQNPIVGNIIPPQLIATYQEPHSGENVAAILVNSGYPYNNYREYIQNELIQTLENGRLYDIEYFISGGEILECMANQFGVKFFTTKYYDPNALWLTEYAPDAVNDIALFEYDTTTWQKVSMQYTANGTENFVIIGNFQDSLSMTYTLPCDTSFWNGLTLGGGYFLIDDVSITLSPACASIPNVFTPNGDGINDLFFATVQNCEDWQLYILNRWGTTLDVLDSNSSFWDGGNHPDGTYFYRLYGQECALEKQGFFQLVRS
jgi:gliding motility-associated-like protein